MKKILSIILAILMIVTCVPFAFAAESGFVITHQPTMDELYVETNDPSATYQWYEMVDGYEIDDTTATKAGTIVNGYSKYNAETGWTPSTDIFPSETHTYVYFEVKLKANDIITIQFSSDQIEDAYLDNIRGGNDIQIIPDGNTATCIVTSNSTYQLCVEAKEQITARAWVEGSEIAMEGETSAQLDATKITEGNEYFCEVTFANGTPERSNKVLAHQHVGVANCLGHKCSICGELMSDAIGEHSGNYLTCYGYKCDVCSEYFGETGNHGFFVYEIITAPTEKREGIAKATCNYGCGTESIKRLPVLSSKAEVDVVYNEAGDRVGFKSITAGGKMYYDIFEGQGDTVDDLSVSEFYKKVLTADMPSVANNLSLAEAWGQVASGVYQAAGRGYGWNYEYANFNDLFGKETSDNNSDVDVALRLGSAEPYSTGDLNDDCVRSTGLQTYSSLSVVQDMMLDQIIDVCGERNDAEDFRKVVLEFCTGDEEGFELFKDTEEQVVVANIVTSLEEDSALEKEFSTFGIAYYDFQLTPIIEENLQYISAADNYESIKDAFENNAPGVSYTASNDGSSSISYIQNPTSAPASVSASSSKSTTNSVSNSFSESESHSFSESISASSKFTTIDKMWEFSLGLSFSTSDAISTAFSESTSLSETTSTSSSASVTLPAYTELGIKQTMSSTEQSVEYDCPVYLTYKVAVFGVNAQYIQDANTGSWSITNYDQGCIFTTFGTDSTVGGISAVDNLYNRVTENSKAFEFSYGKTYGQWEDQNDGNLPTKLDYIDWNKAGNLASDDLLVLEMKTNIPMSSVGGTMIFKTESINTEITQIYPMYDLKRVRFENDGKYNLAIGGNLDLNTVNVIGLNEFDRDYYGFLARMGTWHLCDENGNDIPAFEAGKGITITPTPTSQIITANELGDYYLRFDIDEEYYTKAVDRKTYITNDDLEMTAIMKVSVTDTGNNHTCRPGGWITYIPANCVVEGERYRNCLTCSKRMATEVIPKADHIPVEVVTPATCTTDGSKTTTCLTCKAIISNEVIPATGHGSTYSVTTVTPTCIRDGEKALYCLDCNMLIGSEAIASTGHDNGVWRIDFEATPEHEGQMTKYCSICNVALESKTFAYHTHSYTAWGMNGNGTHTRSCHLCSFTETANCDYDETVTPATCTVDGKTTYQCKDCKHKYSETSSYAQGHSWGTWTASEDGNHSASCTVCGESEASPHIFVEYIPNNDATKDSDGTKTATCVICAAKDTIIDEGSKLPAEPDEPAEPDTPDAPDDGDCDHLCHKDGFMGFFWKIIRVFWKLFRMNPVCECGAAHY